MDDLIIFAVYLGSLDSTQNLLKFQPGNCGVCVCVRCMRWCPASVTVDSMSG